MGISSYSTTPALNTAISGINLAEGCNASGINDAIRQMMADLAAQLGAAGAISIATAVLTGVLTAASVSTSGPVAAGGALSAGSTLIPQSTSAVGAAGNNYDLGLVAPFKKVLNLLTWNGGSGWAMLFVDAANNVSVVSSNNAAGGDNCFDTTNGVGSNGGNGVAAFVSGGHMFIQTKTSYAAGAINLHRFGG